MSQLVIHAQIVDQVGLAQTRSTVVHPGPWPQRVEERIHSFRLPPSEWRRHQEASTLNLQHDPTLPCGRLVALERGLDGSLWGTWTSSELALLKGGAPLYVSAEAAWTGGDADARDIRLLGAAIVPATGAVSTKPATLLVGRLDDSRDRRRWRLSGDLAERIERAAQALARRRNTSDPVTIHNEPESRAMARRVEAQNRERRYSTPSDIRTLGRPLPPQLREGWVPGMLEWSTVGGKVLDVR